MVLSPEHQRKTADAKRGQKSVNQDGPLECFLSRFVWFFWFLQTRRLSITEDEFKTRIERDWNFLAPVKSSEFLHFDGLCWKCKETSSSSSPKPLAGVRMARSRQLGLLNCRLRLCLSSAFRFLPSTRQFLFNCRKVRTWRSAACLVLTPFLFLEKRLFAHLADTSPSPTFLSSGLLRR